MEYSDKRQNTFLQTSQALAESTRPLSKKLYQTGFLFYHGFPRTPFTYSSKIFWLDLPLGLPKSPRELLMRSWQVFEKSLIIDQSNIRFVF